MDNLIELLQRRIWLGPLIALLLLLVGFGVGLGVGWATAEFTPSADDVAAAADSYAFNNNLDLARARLRGLSKADQERALSNLIRDANAKNKTIEAQHYTQLAQALGLTVGSSAALPPGATTVPTRSSTPTASGPTAAKSPIPDLILLIVLAVVLVVILAAIAWLVLTKIVPALRGAPVERRRAEPAPMTVAARPTATSSHAAVPGGLGHFVASYTLGNDNYDTSFSLETGRQEFLGECGMGISETVGEGKPDKVTAFDLWLFDKADVRTVTQILMSEHAFNDQGLRAKLAAKGELVPVEKGKTITIETQSLRLNAQIIELVYATSPNYPPNSHFQKLTVEIVPSLKEVVPA